MGIGETGVGEMGVGETGTSRLPCPNRRTLYILQANIFSPLRRDIE